MLSIGADAVSELKKRVAAVEGVSQGLQRRFANPKALR